MGKSEIGHLTNRTRVNYVYVKLTNRIDYVVINGLLSDYMLSEIMR